MKQLIKEEAGYSLYVDGVKVLHQDRDYRLPTPTPFDEQSLAACFEQACQDLGLNPDGTEPSNGL